jgi:HPr kinase/phosphorylase
MSDPVNIHASCVAIGNTGILLLGKSGAGKSDLALRLIDGGAKLVADDRTILFVKSGALHARAPASIRGLLEMRGVGIIELSARDQVRLALAVVLGREGLRLPQPQFYPAPTALQPNTKLPQIALDGRFASTPAKIRAALTAFSHKAFRDNFNLK